MNRLLLLGALAVVVLVPTATAAPAATGTLRGTVVAKDRAHRALVVARPGGTVQMLAAPTAFSRTRVGRTVAIRYSSVAGKLPVALTVALEGKAHRALVQGTIVRLAKRRAVINAGGSLLDVTLKAPKRQRALASVLDAPRAGDTVKVEVEIGDDGSLDAGTLPVATDPAASRVGSAGEMEVRGKVTVLSPLTVEAGTPPVSISCVVPPGVTPGVALGAMIELKCDLIGGAWTVRVAHGEHGRSGSGDDHSSEVTVRGVLSFSLDGLNAIVTPSAPGLPVTCAIPSRVLAKVTAQFTAGDIVKMECVTVGDTPTLKEIEKRGGGNAAQQGGNAHDGQNGDHNDDDSGDDEGDD